MHRMLQMPRGMREKEQELAVARKEPAFSLLGHLIRRVNDDGANLYELSKDLGMSNDTLLSWCRQCGWDYRVDKKMLPLQPMEPAVQTTE